MFEMKEDPYQSTQSKENKNLRNMLGKFIKKPIKVIIYSIRQKISLCALDLLT